MPHTLHDRLEALQSLLPRVDLALALAAYLRAKMAWLAARPAAPRAGANAPLYAAPVSGRRVRAFALSAVRAMAAFIDGWVPSSRRAAVDSTHPLFTFWDARRNRAELDVQVCAVLGRGRQTLRDHAGATDPAVSLVLRGCGLK